MRETKVIPIRVRTADNPFWQHDTLLETYDPSFDVFYHWNELDLDIVFPEHILSEEYLEEKVSDLKYEVEELKSDKQDLELENKALIREADEMKKRIRELEAEVLMSKLKYRLQEIND